MVARLKALARPAWLDRLTSYRGDLTLPHRVLFWTVACGLGFLRAWNARHRVAWDGVSYLDMGDAFLSRGWFAGINTCWSPLYAWLVVLPNHLFGISRQWESRALHLVNFAIWIGVIAAFEALVNMVIARDTPSTSDDGTGDRLPPWSLRLLCYSLFLHGAVVWLGPAVDTPDLLVEGLFFGLIAVVGRLRARSRAVDAILLGALSGIGYLAKTIMFPIAFVFFWIGLVKKPRAAPARIALALASFLLVSIPVAATVSKKVGRASIGEAGRLNYLWYVNGIAKWPPGRGVDDAHTVRQALREPVVFEFADEAGGSVPLWYAPHEWHGGQQAHFAVWQQLRVLAANLNREAHVAFACSEFAVFLLFAWVLRRRSRPMRRGLATHLDLLAPSIAVLILYALVAVQPRYIAGALVAIWIGAVAGIAPRTDDRSRRVIACLTLAVALTSAVRIAGHVGKDIQYTLRMDGKWVNDEWLVAERLRQLGIQPGDRVASAGWFLDAYWPRLAGVQMVANVADDHAGNRWIEDPSRERAVLDAMRTVRVKAVIARASFARSFPSDWQPIPGSPFVVRSLFAR